MLQHIRTYMLLVLFLLGICFPFVNSRLHLVNDIATFENRRLSPKPYIDLKRLDPFPEKYTSYYNDTFNLRNRLIRWYNYYNIQCFNQSPVKSVILGRDKWLFLAGEELDSYMGRNMFTEAQLKTLASELSYRASYLAERGMLFYFMVVPCKMSIYTDKVGYQFYRISTQTWGEQLNEYLTRHTRLNVINLFDSLRTHKEPHQLYFKLDNHWNELGAFYAARQAILHIKKDLPQIQPLSLDQFELSTSLSNNGNINKMFGYLNMFEEVQVNLLPKDGWKAKDGKLSNYSPTPGFAYPWEYEKVKQIDSSSAPRLLLISDSFGTAIFQFLSESFSKTTKIWDAWHYELNTEIVNNEKPNVVLLMIDEPILHNLLDSRYVSNPGLRGK